MDGHVVDIELIPDDTVGVQPRLEGIGDSLCILPGVLSIEAEIDPVEWLPDPIQDPLDLVQILIGQIVEHLERLVLELPIDAPQTLTRQLPLHALLVDLATDPVLVGEIVEGVVVEVFELEPALSSLGLVEVDVLGQQQLFDVKTRIFFFLAVDGHLPGHAARHRVVWLHHLG